MDLPRGYIAAGTGAFYPEEIPEIPETDTEGRAITIKLKKDKCMKDSTVNINIEIEGKAIAGYEFFVDGKLVLWEDMNRKQQVSVLNSLIHGYGLFKKFLKEE